MLGEVAQGLRLEAPWKRNGRGLQAGVAGRGRGLSLSAPGAVLNLGSSVLARAQPMPRLALKDQCESLQLPFM